MGRSPFLYVRDQSWQLVRVQPETKKTEQRRTNEPSGRKQTIRGEKPLEVKGVLDELDRTILELGVRTPEEAHKRLGILLMEAEARMMRSIPAKFEVNTFEEALEKYKKRLPMKI